MILSRLNAGTFCDAFLLTCMHILFIMALDLKVKIWLRMLFCQMPTKFLENFGEKRKSRSASWKASKHACIVRLKRYRTKKRKRAVASAPLICSSETSWLTQIPSWSQKAETICSVEQSSRQKKLAFNSFTCMIMSVAIRNRKRVSVIS